MKTDPKHRENICKDMEFIGIDFDKQKNEGARGKELVISKKGSKVTVMIVPTNEELVIATDTSEIVENRTNQDNTIKLKFNGIKEPE